MSVVEDLYREIILDHYRNPRYKGELPPPALKVEGANPLCGDQLSLFLEIKDGKLSNLRISAAGCSISCASASMMAEVILGKKLDEIDKAIERFKEMMLNKNGNPESLEDLGDIETLQGVKKYPVRIKCALLPWNTLIEALKAVRSQKPAEKVVME